jgi:phosphoserine aminotransferase
MKHNFSAGPASLPKEVLAKVQKELLDFDGSGVSVLEISHRSSHFEKILSDAEQDLRSLVDIPENYKVLFLQGGASTAFASVVLNLADKEKPVDYVVTGTWSDKAAKEAKLLGAKVNIAVDTKDSGYTRVPPVDKWKLSSDPSYIYYCDNETVNGVEFPTSIVDSFPRSVPIVCDMSSNFCTRRIDVSKYGIIYAGAQK